MHHFWLSSLVRTERFQVLSIYITVISTDSESLLMASIWRVKSGCNHERFEPLGGNFKSILCTSAWVVSWYFPLSLRNQIDKNFRFIRFFRFQSDFVKIQEVFDEWNGAFLNAGYTLLYCRRLDAYMEPRCFKSAIWSGWRLWK